ncbi:PVC-type heme-binding CxxCH protein [Membranihabitans maritimus]|uniref:PVC-type heme-binding CxxCH protein n=1 Tax=Membranihabitans maritimus TaxID=2904244 RepID=UPI001F022A5B|nr:PVC-type heme-binding CxxCH protein [Membranihabitans maritimus]
MKKEVIGFLIIGLYLLISCNINDQSIEIKNDLMVAGDLEAILWAETPQFYNPTAMDVDYKGRLWVTEAVNYRSFKHDGKNPFHHPNGDRVVILEDTDGDGHADSSKVFVQDKDLQAPVGIAVIGNKVIVSSAPSLIVYTDNNGDDIPDDKEIFLTGFGGYDHDHSLHSVIAGPDGNWYFNTGNAGPHIVEDNDGWTLRSGSIYNGGTPYNTDNKPGLVSDDGRIWTGGLALRISPGGKGLKVMAHNFRNAYELTLDSYGNMWQNDNDDEVSACRATWVMENGNAGYFNADGSRSWRADQRPGQSIFTAHWHQEDPGVMPAGDNTGSGAPTGVAIYESDILGKEYQGMFLSADAGRNVVFGYKPTVIGAGFDLSNPIKLATSVRESTEDYRWNNMNIDSTKWFRPSDVVIGTDGAIYICDWYDPIVGGHAMHDTTGYGRIYRITPKGQRLGVPKLDLNTKEGQIQALLNPAINVRNLGFTALSNRGENIVNDILEIVNNSSNPYHQARAVWLLSTLGPSGMKEVEKIFEYGGEDLRIVALRALKTCIEVPLDLYEKGSKDPSPAVRREVAIAIRDLPYRESKQLLFTLLEGYDGKDRWYLEALGTAACGKESQLYIDILRSYGEDPVKWPENVFNFVWRLHPEKSVESFKAIVLSDESLLEQRKKAMVGLAFISTKESAMAMQEIVRLSNNEVVQEYGEWWLRYRASNDWAGYYKIMNKKEEIPGEVREWRNLLLAEDSSKDAKSKAIVAMAQDPYGGEMLLQIAAGNRISKELKDIAANYIFSNPNQSVRVLAGEYFDAPLAEKKISISEVLDLTGDSDKGGEVYREKCSSCHKVNEMGADIGPDLTNIRNKLDRKAMLDAIINPGADIVFGYEPWLITTEDSTTVFGFVQSEGDFISVRDASGEVIPIPSSKIVKRERTGSLMPDPASLNLSNQDLSDIVAYLINLK